MATGTVEVDFQLNMKIAIQKRITAATRDAVLAEAQAIVTETLETRGAPDGAQVNVRVQITPRLIIIRVSGNAFYVEILKQRAVGAGRRGWSRRDVVIEQDVTVRTIPARKESENTTANANATVTAVPNVRRRHSAKAHREPASYPSMGTISGAALYPFRPVEDVARTMSFKRQTERRSRVGNRVRTHRNAERRGRELAEEVGRLHAESEAAARTALAAAISSNTE